MEVQVAFRFSSELVDQIDEYCRYLESLPSNEGETFTRAEAVRRLIRKGLKVAKIEMMPIEPPTVSEPVIVPIETPILETIDQPIAVAPIAPASPAKGRRRSSKQ